MGAVRQMKRRPAKRPAPRTVTVNGSGEFAEWEATARADFPAKVLQDLESQNIGRVMAALDAIIVSHNFPDSDDNIAASMSEVDPYTGLMSVASNMFDALGALPSR